MQLAVGVVRGGHGGVVEIRQAAELLAVGADSRAQQRAGFPPGGLPDSGGVAELFPAGLVQQVRAQRRLDFLEGGVAADVALVALPGVAGRRGEGTLDVDLLLALDRGAP